LIVHWTTTIPVQGQAWFNDRGGQRSSGFPPSV